MLFQKRLIVFGILLQPAYGAPSGDPQWPADRTYRKTVLKHHNVHRKNHSTSDIGWGHDLEKSAKKLAETCIWGHNTSINGGGYGQNLAAGLSRSHVSEAITDLFYNEEMPHFQGLYGQASPNLTNFGSWGHFTQVVWKDTSKVACSTVHCPNGMTDQSTGKALPFYDYTVCNYYPPGNYIGKFDKNIGKPLGMPTVGAQY